MTVSVEEKKAEAPKPQENVVQQTPPKEEEKKGQTSETAPETKDNEDPNWKAFREARKKDRIEREAAEKRAAEKAAEAEALKAAMEAILNKPQPQQPQQGYQDQYPHEETEDERIEKKVQAAIRKKEEEYNRQREEQERTEFPARLQTNFSDFNQTVSQENLDYLEYHYPEVARPLQRLQDGYEKWADIYKAVKKFVPNAANAKKDASRAESNLAKPKSLSSPGITQPDEGTGSARLSKERRAANWERMQKLLRSVG